ncbi:MAG: hypothetical protein HOE90_09520 [Bacteriovoracaceae bacterium]|jgi:predicted membrane metal-binding protein|nr:hypothetical protein [Bacteriovoracaceae bacterium]
MTPLGKKSSKISLFLFVLSVISLLYLKGFQNYSYTYSKNYRAKLNYPIKSWISPKKNQNHAFYYAVITGKKRYLARELRSKVRLLGLSHIFTPSGLHVGSLLSILSPLKWFKIPKRGLIELLFLTFVWLFSHFLFRANAAKRICILYSIFRFPPLKSLSLSHVLALSFLLDLLLGGFVSSPFSFFLSLLFIAIIFYSIDTRSNRGDLALRFFSAQYFVAFIFNGETSWLNILFTPLLTVLFTLVFPCVTLMKVLGWNEGFNYLLSLNIKVIEESFDYAQSFGRTSPALTTSLLLLFVSFRRFTYKKKILVVLCWLMIQPAQIHHKIDRIKFRSYPKVIKPTLFRP